MRSLKLARAEVSPDQHWQRASQIALIGLFVVALLWCAYVAQHVIVPVLLAWTIATIVLPGVKWMERHGIPRALAAIVITFALLALILTLVLLLSAPLTYWLGRATYVGALLHEKLASFSQPLLWGVLATLLNYVPYLGPAVVIGTLAIVGLLLYPTLEEAAVAPLFYLGLVTIEGQFITPTLMGRRLEINPFAVFLAIAFCTWFWGPVGAFLAVPLLMALSVALQNSFEEEKPDLPN